MTINLGKGITMSLSKREKFLLYLLIFIVIVGSYVNFLIFPRLDKIKEKKLILQQKRSELHGLQQAKKAGKLKEVENQIQDEINKIERAIPAQANIPGVYLDILSIAEKAGVEQESLNMQNATIAEENTRENEEAKEDVHKQSEQLLTLSIVHKIRGTYEEIENYIHLIQTCERKLDIIEYEIISSKNEKNNNGLLASFTLKSYGLVKDGQNYSEFVEYNFSKGNYGRANPFQSNQVVKDDAIQDTEEQE